MATQVDTDSNVASGSQFDSWWARGIFVFTCLAIGPYNWLVLARLQIGSIWIGAVLSFVFLLAAALTSIPAGVSLRRYADQKLDTAAKAVRLYTLFLFVFVIESVSLPAIRASWSTSPILAIVSGATIAVQLLVTSYLQKILWDRSVKLLEEQAD